MAYWTAFPESHAKMDETFKQDLLDVVHEWVTGMSNWEYRLITQHQNISRLQTGNDSSISH
jgi:hypothetical protein